jgi:protein-S-isoprenylcysteine O-methyltransferase Ste14
MEVRKMDKREGEVKDLMEELERGKTTPKEIVQTLEERRLTEKAILKYGAWSYVVWAVLCFLPAIAKLSGLELLSLFAQLPSVEFPAIVIYLSVVLFIAAIPLTAAGMFYNIRQGGCRSEDATILLLRNGPYRIVRHPSHVAWCVFFVTIPIILSEPVPFTVLSVIGIVWIVVFSYYASLKEERELDLRKWGDAYREYMKEVPRWNVFKGLWNLVRR